MNSIKSSLTRAFPSVVATVCGYEAVAITSRGRIPTITALQQQHRIIGPIMVGGLLAHFYGEYLNREHLDGRVPLAIARLAWLSATAKVHVAASLALRAQPAQVKEIFLDY